MTGSGFATTGVMLRQVLENQLALMEALETVEGVWAGTMAKEYRATQKLLGKRPPDKDSVWHPKNDDPEN